MNDFKRITMKEFLKKMLLRDAINWGNFWKIPSKKHIWNNEHNKTFNNRQIIKIQKTHQSSYFVIKKMYKNTLWNTFNFFIKIK